MPSAMHPRRQMIASPWQKKRNLGASNLEGGVVIAGTGQAAFQLAGCLREEGYAGHVRLVGDEVYLPYQRPPLSKAYMNGDCEATDLAFQPHDYYRKQNVELTLGTRINRIDRKRRYV